MAGPWDTPPTPEELAGWNPQPPTPQEIAAAYEQRRQQDPYGLQEPAQPQPPQERGRLESLALGLESGIPFLSRVRRAVNNESSVIPEVNKLTEEREREEAWQQHPWFYGPGKAAGMAWTGYGLGRVPGTQAALGAGWLGPAGRLASGMRFGALWGGLEGADTAMDAQSPQEAASAVGEGLVRGAEFGLAAEPVAAGVGKLPGVAANVLKRASEKNAIRALGAPGAVGKLVSREGEHRVPAVARQLLDEGVPLRKPSDALRAIKGTMSEKYGPALEVLTSQAEQAGARFNLGSVLDRFQKQVPELVKDPQKQPIVAAVQDYLTKVATKRGLWTPDQRMLTELTPAEAWGLRQNLDTYLRGVQKNLDPTGNLTKSLFNDVRHSVDEELGRAMSSVGLGGEWKAANAAYRNLSAGQKLAKSGVVREATREASEPKPISGLMDALGRTRRALVPRPSTKAKVQNTLYRLMSPKGPEAPLARPPPAAGPQVEPGYTWWRPSGGPSPIPYSPEAAYRPGARPPAPSHELTPEELARARAEVLAGHQEAQRTLKNRRMSPPED